MTIQQTMFPDTLDLTKNAELALNGLCRTVDPDDDYLMYFEVRANANPPYMLHSGCDIECAPKFWEAIMQMRIMCGSEKFTDIEQSMQEKLLSFIGTEDGFYYARSTPKRPWNMAAYTDQDYKEDYTLPNTAAIMMTALMHSNEQHNGKKWDGLLNKISQGIKSICVTKDNYAYWPAGDSGHPFSRPQSGWKNQNEPESERASAEGSIVAYFGYTMRALSMWAARSGDEKSLELAGKLAAFVMKPKFWGGFNDSPCCSGADLGHVNSHFHARAIALRGLLEYAIVANDPRIGEFVRSSYEYMRSFGIPFLGFVPCFTGFQSTGGGVSGVGRYMEGCLLGDLVAITVKLSDAGFGDYWEDADRIIRNHLVEAQWTDKKVLERIVEDSLKRPPGSDYNFGPYNNNKQPQKQYPANFEYNGSDMLDRIIGIYPGYVGVVSTDWARVMQCCTSNAIRGLYYGWEAITRCKNNHAQVNLLLNRSSTWLDIESYLPYEGKVIIRNKTMKSIAVRIPTWVKASQCQCKLNNQNIEPIFNGRYVSFGQVKPNDSICITFPIKQQSITFTADKNLPEETVYSIDIQGNTVTKISPRNESPTAYQYYKRDFLLDETTVDRKVSLHTPLVVPKW